MVKLHSSVALGISVYLALVLFGGEADAKGAQNRFYPTIELGKSNFTTDKKFVSVAVGTRTYVRTQGRNAQLKIRNNGKLDRLMRALAPCTIRIGGSWANFFVFKKNDKSTNMAPKEVIEQWEATFGGSFYGEKVGTKGWHNMFYTGRQAVRLARFILRQGWDILFDINQFLQKDGLWDETNFRQMLDYVRRYNITIEGFTLGNEPNAYLGRNGFNKTVESMVEDYRKFRRVIGEYPEYKDAMIIGPDSTSLARSWSAQVFVDKFMAIGGPGIVDALGMHHYYLNGRTAEEKDFLDPQKFDIFTTLTQKAQEIKKLYAPGIPLYMTETANAFGGGSVLYSNKFASTFLYMDELGMCAKHGIARVHRQSLNSASYALINSKTLKPNPDYYVALLHKQLVEGPVLEVTFEPQDARVRIYAHCARRDVYGYGKEAVVIYFMNLKNRPVSLDFRKMYGEQKPDVFLLTPGRRGDLTSRSLRLNNRRLGGLPRMKPVSKKMPLRVPKQSLGFLVFNQGEGKVCADYHNKGRIQLQVLDQTEN